MLKLLMLLLFASFHGTNGGELEISEMNRNRTVESAVPIDSKDISVKVNIASVHNKIDGIKVIPEPKAVVYSKTGLIKIIETSESDGKHGAIKMPILKESIADSKNESIKVSIIPKPETDNKNKSLKVIPKCCPIGQLILVSGWDRKCIKHNNLNKTFENLDFSDVRVHNKDLNDTGRKVNEEFEFDAGRILNSSFNETALNFAVMLHNFYLTEHGILYQEVPNEWKRWHILNTSRYCLEYELKESKFSRPVPRFWTVLEQPDEELLAEEPVIAIGLMISCVFLSLVLLVYAMLPELRNLGGKVQMVYVISLLAAFALLATMQLGEHSVNGCKGLTYSTYFFFLASFCWMNVMSCDIWWTFRGYAKARKMHSHGETFKFFMYCLYAFGVPLAMTVFLVICNELDLRHLPWFVTPNVPNKACFIIGEEKFLYMYIPMLVLILANWTFFLMTAFNIWRVQRSLAVLNSAAAGTPAAHRQQKYRLLMYLKLSVIMGINWLLEVVSSFYPNFKGWYLTDGYNMLIGVSIFLILVCKRRVFRMIRIKYKNLRITARLHGWVSRRPCLRRLLHLNPDAYGVHYATPGRRRYAVSDSETSSTEITAAPVCIRDSSLNNFSVPGNSRLSKLSRQNS